MNTRMNGLGIFAALLVSAVMGAAAWGDLVIDLRLPASVSGDPKHLELTASTPSSIEVSVFARITGAAGNSAHESFRSVMGSFKTPYVQCRSGKTRVCRQSISWRKKPWLLPELSPV